MKCLIYAFLRIKLSNRTCDGLFYVKKYFLGDYKNLERTFQIQFDDL